MERSDRIRRARELRGMTQEELGRACGTTKQTIFKYESGIVTNIPTDRIESIAMAEKTFYSKMERRVFGTDEVEVMIDLLNIGNPIEIFFAKK